MYPSPPYSILVDALLGQSRRKPKHTTIKLEVIFGQFAVRGGLKGIVKESLLCNFAFIGSVLESLQEHEEVTVACFKWLLSLT